MQGDLLVPGFNPASLRKGKVAADGKGLIGHAGAVLLRKAADMTGLTGYLSAALRKKSASPLLDRGIVIVSMAAAIALGATCMSDIAPLAYSPRCSGPRPAGRRSAAPWTQPAPGDGGPDHPRPTAKTSAAVTTALT